VLQKERIILKRRRNGAKTIRKFYVGASMGIF
jgi:hypothetical protein